MKFFQPGPKKPGKNLPKLKYKIAIGGLALSSLALIEINWNEKPHCTLQVKRVHYSTYMNEYHNTDSVKLNITSSCNVPQEYTLIYPEILVKKQDQSEFTYKFGSRKKFANAKDSREAIFEDLFVECKKGIPANYRGRAAGIVRFEDGKSLSVSGRSDIFNYVNCRIDQKV